MVPTDEAMITRQMLYSALPVPATAAFAINSSVYPQYLVLLALQQNRVYRQFGSGQYRKLPLPLSKTRHGKNDDMRPGSKFDLGWRAAHILAVERDIRAGRSRTEITLYLL